MRTLQPVLRRHTAVRPTTTENPMARTHITRRSALAIAAIMFAAPNAFAQNQVILVHRDPNCGCCGKWIGHLKTAGFAVTVQETSDLAAVRKRLGVPPELAACHTAEIDGFVIEGHVPALAIRRLLEKRPSQTGLAVPGMPIGSPGMEGAKAEEYDVVLFGKGGRQPFMRFIGGQLAG